MVMGLQWPHTHILCIFLKGAGGISNKEHVPCEGAGFNDEKGCLFQIVRVGSFGTFCSLFCRR